jgi:hypothetical protein
LFRRATQCGFGAGCQSLGDTDFCERYSAPGIPTPPPQSHSLDVHRHALGDSCIALPHRRQQHYPRATHERLACFLSTYQPFQLAVLGIRQHDLRRLWSRHFGHSDPQDASSWPAIAPRLWATLEQIGFLPREQLTWIKALNPEDIVTSTAWGSWCSTSNPVLRAVAEPVFIASKVTHTRSPGVSDLTSAEFKAWTRNAWNIPAGNAERDLDHPCKFPPELPRRLIKLYSYVGDMVLDPFCGSGTTPRLAKDLSRRAIGVDISRRYCAMSADRCRQQLLFAAEVLAAAPDGLN